MGWYVAYVPLFGHMGRVSVHQLGGLSSNPTKGILLNLKRWLILIWWDRGGGLNAAFCKKRFLSLSNC